MDELGTAMEWYFESNDTFVHCIQWEDEQLFASHSPSDGFLIRLGGQISGSNLPPVQALFVWHDLQNGQSNDYVEQ